MDSREGIALQNLVLELRRDLQYLRDQMGRDGSAPQPRSSSTAPGSGSGEMTAQLLDRVARLEEQLRSLNGRQEEVVNRLQRFGEDVTKQLADIDFRMEALEGGRRAGTPLGHTPQNLSPQAGNPGATQPPSRQSATPPSRAERTPEAVMQEGNAALARRDYATAEASAREILAIRASPRSYDGQLLLAQALTGKRDHAQAAIAFDDTYKRAPTGRHAQDALLGLAASLAALDEKRSACDTLNTFRKEFPTPRPELRDTASNLRQRAGCR